VPSPKPIQKKGQSADTMETILSLLTGLLVALGVYLLLRRSLVQVLLGIMFLSHAANLVIFVSGGLRRDVAPMIDAQGGLPAGSYADPLPQALILTAIVIGFGLLAFALALVMRAQAKLGTDDVDQLQGEGSDEA
jgi:multicomponent Na+:H+ antiporter subunit C